MCELPCVVATGPEPGVGIHHTAEYSSPELLNELRLQKVTSSMDMCANDVWSLGCLLAWALTGQELFGFSSHQQRPPAYQHRIDHACSRQRPWVCACPLLLLPICVSRFIVVWVFQDCCCFAGNQKCSLLRSSSRQDHEQYVMSFTWVNAARHAFIFVYIRQIPDKLIGSQ